MRKNTILEIPKLAHERLAQKGENPTRMAEVPSSILTGDTIFWWFYWVSSWKSSDANIASLTLKDYIHKKIAALIGHI